MARHFGLMVFFGCRDIWLVGWLPMLAGLAMAMSYITVVGNSILLGRYDPKFSLQSEKKVQEENQEIRVNPSIRTKISKRRVY